MTIPYPAKSLIIQYPPHRKSLEIPSGSGSLKNYEINWSGGGDKTKYVYFLDLHNYCTLTFVHRKCLSGRFVCSHVNYNVRLGRRPQLQSFHLPTSKVHNSNISTTVLTNQDQKKPDHKLIILLSIFTLGTFLLPYTLITIW